MGFAVLRLIARTIRDGRPKNLDDAGGGRVRALAFLAIAAGVSSVLQTSVNANLRTGLNSPNRSALISYAGGTLVMALIVLGMRDPLPNGAAVRSTHCASSAPSCSSPASY
jgi:Putative inner membrane exporter, YdcZ